jgi:hypothetical protein
MAITKFDCGQTGLSNANHVVARQDSRDGVSLDGGGHSVFAEFDVLNQDGMDASCLEL